MSRADFKITVLQAVSGKIYALINDDLADVDYAHLAKVYHFDARLVKGRLYVERKKKKTDGKR